MNNSIGIIGLGRCGMPAAQKFMESGYQVFGCARRPGVIAAFEKWAVSTRPSHLRWPKKQM
jgi:3-hydroxyisobutyrate dehydrogenase-like beta-hydroxyacid dehydrogenase